MRNIYSTLQCVWKGLLVALPPNSQRVLLPALRCTGESETARYHWRLAPHGHLATPLQRLIPLCTKHKRQKEVKLFAVQELINRIGFTVCSGWMEADCCGMYCVYVATLGEVIYTCTLCTWCAPHCTFFILKLFMKIFTDQYNPNEKCWYDRQGRRRMVWMTDCVMYTVQSVAVLGSTTALYNQCPLQHCRRSAAPSVKGMEMTTQVTHPLKTWGNKITPYKHGENTLFAQ